MNLVLFYNQLGFAFFIPSKFTLLVPLATLRGKYMIMQTNPIGKPYHTDFALLLYRNCHLLQSMFSRSNLLLACDYRGWTCLLGVLSVCLIYFMLGGRSSPTLLLKRFHTRSNMITLTRATTHWESNRFRARCSSGFVQQHLRNLFLPFSLDPIHNLIYLFHLTCKYYVL